jgi:hypothetical protein
MALTKSLPEQNDDRGIYSRERSVTPTVLRRILFTSGRNEMAPRKNSKNWSADVTENSDAMDLKKDIFESDDPKEIARSLKHSAESSDRRKSSPFRSAMSMLTFYINRAGKNLSAGRRKKLDSAKNQLRKEFGKPPQ